MFIKCRGAWSVHRADSIVLGVMNLLERKELRIIKNCAHSSADLWSVSKVFSISRAVRVFFRGEAEFFAKCKVLVQDPFLQFASLICHLFPFHEQYVSWKPMDLSGLVFRWSWSYVFLKCLQCIFAHFLTLTTTESILNRQIASGTVCRDTLCKRTISHCRFP
ncbi:hypothetical protein TNCV_4591921 [Trichonephila clavipes]|nr:hypothetical protein TNCV_4591921 [Trichonephila clavipes]